MGSAIREFQEREEVAAALSKATKRKKRKKRDQWFTDYLRKQIAHIEANGNPARAEGERKFWARVSNGRYSKAVAVGTAGVVVAR